MGRVGVERRDGNFRGCDRFLKCFSVRRKGVCDDSPAEVDSGVGLMVILSEQI